MREDMTFDYDPEWGRLCRALCDDALRRFTSLETFIWRIATLADGADLPATQEGMGSWAVSLWWLDRPCVMNVSPLWPLTRLAVLFVKFVN